MGVLWVALRRRSRHVVISKREKRKKRSSVSPFPTNIHYFWNVSVHHVCFYVPGVFISSIQHWFLWLLTWYESLFFLQYNCDLKTWSNAANAYYCFRICSSHLQFFFLCTNKQILLNVVVWHHVPFVVFGMAFSSYLLPSPDDASGLTQRADQY